MSCEPIAQMLTGGAARVIDQDVDPAESRVRRFGHRLRLRASTEIADRDLDPAASFLMSSAT